VAILWTFEPHIKQLHPVSHENRQCAGLRCDKLVSNDPGKGLEMIMGCKNLEELSLEFRTSRNSAYCLNKLLKIVDPPQQTAATKKKLVPWDAKPRTGKTIEFRQHRGTLDGDEIVNLIRLCAGLSQLAQVMKEESLMTLLRTWIQILPDANGLALDRILRYVVRLPEFADYYQNQERIPYLIIDDEYEVQRIRTKHSNT
jgi:hypothetical protein